MNENYEAVAESLQLTKSELVQLAKNAFEVSFMDSEKKKYWMAKVDELDKENT